MRLKNSYELDEFESIRMLLNKDRDQGLTRKRCMPSCRTTVFIIVRDTYPHALS